MNRGDKNSRYALTAFAMALAAIVFASWFSQPSDQEIDKRNNRNSGAEQQNAYRPEESLWPQFTPSDTYAQWIVALLTCAATGISVWAVILVRDTLMLNRDAVKAADNAVEMTREIGRDQSRAYLHVEAIDYKTGGKVGRPTATAWVKNVGQTPAKWFYLVGVASVYPVDFPIPDTVETDPGVDMGVTWSAIGGGDKLSAPIAIDDAVSKAIKSAYGNRENYMLVVSGFVRYETYYSEIFESEFMFVCRPLPGFARPAMSDRQAAASSAGWAVYITGEAPQKMQRVGRRLSVYKFVENHE